MSVKAIIRIGILGLLFCAGAASAQAQTLTGIWEGRATCSGVLNDAAERVKGRVRISIHQRAEDVLAAYMTFREDDGPTVFTGPECGFLASPLAGGNAHAVLASESHPTVQGFDKISLFPANSRGETGRLTGAGVIASGGVTSLSCKFSLRRISTGTPSLPSWQCAE